MCASTRGCFCLFRSCPRCRSIPSFRRSVCRALPGVFCPAGRLYYSAAALTLRLAGAWRLTRQSRGVPRPAAPLGWGPRPFPRSPLRGGREACHSATLRVRLPVHRSPRPLSPLRYAPGAFRPGYGESGRGQARVLFYRLRAAFRTASASFRRIPK